MKERLLTHGQRPSSKATTAEHAKDAEYSYKKEGFLCELGDLCGEMKRPSVASGFACLCPCLSASEGQAGGRQVPDVGVGY